MTQATAFLHRLRGLAEPALETAFAAEIDRAGGSLSGDEPVRLSLHGIVIGAPTAGEAMRKWMKIATWRATVDTDLALAERVLHQPGTDRATLRWACGTLLRHSQDAWLRNAAETVLAAEDCAA